MKESIIKAFEGVMDKYDKSYSRDGVLENLRAWEANKADLINLLRKHPNWNEDALAIVFETEEDRPIDRGLVNSFSYELKQLAYALELPKDDVDAFVLSINCIRNEYSKNIKEDSTAIYVKKVSGVNCVVGQKTSRVINAICLKYGIDKHECYSKYFSRLADALNPLSYKRKAILSVHPCDFLEMSNRDNNWSSCHCLDDGGWQAGTLSYMNDSVSMIFCTIDDGIKKDFFRAPKITRQVFAYHNGILLQSRVYPYPNDDIARENYRNIVQMAFAVCNDIPNLWLLKKSQAEVNSRVSTWDGSLHYRDYTYECYKANVSILKEMEVSESEKLVIGHDAYCVDCSCVLDSSGDINCGDCTSSGHTCANCGGRYEEEDMHMIDGDWYCVDCCQFCDCCEEYFLEDATRVTNRWGSESWVCNSCLEEYYEECEDCGEYVWYRHGEEIGDSFYCRHCIEANFSICSRCDEYVHNDVSVVIGFCTYCPSCADQLKEDSEEEEEEAEEQIPVTV